MKKDEHNCEIYHFDLYGTRKEKYAFLQNNSLQTVEWQQLNPQAPNYFFVPKDFSLQEEYEKGFKIDELMKDYGSGVQTKRDELNIFYSDNDRIEFKSIYCSLDEQNIQEKFNVNNGRDWTIRDSRNDLIKNQVLTNQIFHKPFDIRYTNYTGKTRGIMGYPRYEKGKHVIRGSFALILTRQYTSVNDYSYVLVTKYLVTDRFYATTNGTPYFFPLYLYPEAGSMETERRVNMDENIWRKIENWIQFSQAYKPLTAEEQKGKLDFDAEPEPPHITTPEDIFDYIYGILHSPAYRERYKEFLKIDFPRIPYPKNKTDFEHFRKFGEQLRHIHLMEPDALAELEKQYPTLATYDQQGNNIVEQIIYNSDDDTSGVQINDTQFFANVPSEAWEFYIGGYQPAQKWLKDRKNRVLSFDDIAHYRHIIMILVETNRIMQQIQ